MIKRIVKLTFRAEEVEGFLAVFNENCELIRATDGCLYLELLRQGDAPTVFFTLSHWESQLHLDAYRHSALFKATWARTKPRFAAKPVAWSLDSLVVKK